MHMFSVPSIMNEVILCSIRIYNKLPKSEEKKKKIIQTIKSF